jgi:hypothetical protein
MPRRMALVGLSSDEHGVAFWWRSIGGKAIVPIEDVGRNYLHLNPIRLTQKIGAGQIFQDLHILHGGVAIRNLEWRQPSSRVNIMKRLAVQLRSCSQWKRTGRPAFIEIGTRISARSCLEVSSRRRSSRARTNHRAVGIARPVYTTVFHRSYERAVRLRRNDQTLPPMGHERVF